eukprot:GHVS01046746.1.p1 GENE.GHVS01046746.1~~GHVS01046746.1.p1  ORF type:complete len:168 (-),score=48.61 GHVS01046746.1:187-690(-)
MDDEELASEVFVGERSLGVAVGADLYDTEYGVSAGVGGVRVAALRNFEQKQTDIQGNWGDGWQAVVGGDFIDPYSDEVAFGVGVGQLGKAYVQAGAGIGSDGVPQGSAEFEGEDIGLEVAFVDDNGNRVMNYGITVGKFTYRWGSEVDVDNLVLPLRPPPNILAPTT